MARPKKALSEARAVVFGVRLTPDERASLEARAASVGVTVTAYARAAVLGGCVEVAAAPLAVNALGHAPAGVAHIAALNRVGVNLNQIARALNSNMGFIPADLAATLDQVNALLDDWQGVAR